MFLQCFSIIYFVIFSFFSLSFRMHQQRCDGLRSSVIPDRVNIMNRQSEYYCSPLASSLTDGHNSSGHTGSSPVRQPVDVGLASAAEFGGIGGPALGNALNPPSTTHSQVLNLISTSWISFPSPAHHFHVLNFIPRPWISFPGPEPHSQILNLISGSWTSFPGLGPHFQVLIFIRRPWILFPGPELHSQVLNFIPRSWTSFPGLELDFQVLNLIPRSTQMLNSFMFFYADIEFSIMYEWTFYYMIQS